MADETVHLIVKGTVQGVGFRWFVVEEARRLGLAGWVRNNRDGSVEVRARGTTASVSALEAHVRCGPRGSAVSEVQRVDDAEAEDLSKPFSILRN